MSLKSRIQLFVATVMGMVSFTVVNAQPRDTVAGIPVNYDESKVGAYVLPDVLSLNSGEKVSDKNVFVNQRVPEILQSFRENQYGRIPVIEAKCSFDLFDPGTLALNQGAISKQVRVYFSEDTTGPKTDVLIYLPAGIEKPVPLMLMLNFTANSSMVDDSGVRRGEIWNQEKKKVPAPDQSFFGKYDVMPFLEQGIGVAMLYYVDIEPVFAGGIPYGVRGMFIKPVDQHPVANEWGTIAHLAAPSRYFYQFCGNSHIYAQNRMNS